jgi:hypothetical protein
VMPSGLMPTRLGAYGQREAGSVLIPGTLLLIELWLLVFSPEDVDAAGGFLQLASDQIRDARDWILGAALLVGVLAAYTIGLLARMAAWTVFDRFRKGRFQSGASVRKRFETEHGAPPVARALKGHDALETALAGTQHDAFFQYAKLWLRQNRPLLAVEYHETEINFLVAIQVPLLLAAFAVWRHSGIAAFGAALVIVALVAWTLGRKAMSRSHDETFDVMRNFLFAQWFAERAPADERATPAAPQPPATA